MEENKLKKTEITTKYRFKKRDIRYKINYNPRGIHLERREELEIWEFILRRRKLGRKIHKYLAKKILQTEKVEEWKIHIERKKIFVKTICKIDYEKYIQNRSRSTVNKSLEE